MNILFSTLLILPLLLFLYEPVNYTWAPWLSFAIMLFGCFILIPRRRLLFTIPLAIPLVALFLLLTLVEFAWLQQALIVFMGLLAWYWWHLARYIQDDPKQLRPALLFLKLLFLFGASYAGNAFAIFIDEPLWEISLLFLGSSVLMFFSSYVILSYPRFLLSALLVSILTIEFFLAIFYLPVNIFIKSLVLTFFGSSVIDLSLRHAGQILTLRRVRFTLLALLMTTAALFATAEWI